MDDSGTSEPEAETLTGCPLCRAVGLEYARLAGSQNADGSLALNRLGLWQTSECRLCGGRGMVVAKLAARWTQDHALATARALLATEMRGPRHG